MCRLLLKSAPPALIILAVLQVEAQTTAIERVGWTVVWPDSIEFPDGFCQRVEARVIRALEDARSAHLRWIRLPDETRSELAATIEGGLPRYSVLPEWRTRYDEIVVVRVRRRAGRWVGEGYASAPWLPYKRFGPTESVLDVRLLPLVIARLVSDTWVPSVRLIELTNGRVTLAGPSVAPAPGDTAGSVLKAGTIFRVLRADETNREWSYRELRHAFVKVLSGSAADVAPVAKLVAIASDERAIRRALAAGHPVLLVPSQPAPGRIRIRAIDRGSGDPLPSVEVFASSSGYSTLARDLRGVASATGEPVEYGDRQGELWYVSLKSGTTVYEVPLMSSADDKIFDIPITAGDESLLRGEFDFLASDFNHAMDRYWRHLHRGDALTEQNNFAEAHRSYQAARAACQDAAELCNAAERLYERYHPDGEEDERDRAWVERFTTPARSETATRAREIQKRIDKLTGLEELTSRQARAEDLEKQALQYRDRNEIDEALRLYDTAIALLPAGVAYRKTLVEQRARLAEAWRIRGGERQQRARRFVYEQLGLLAAADLAKELPQIRAHIGCLIEYGDRYTLREATGALRRLFEDVMAKAREAKNSGDLNTAEQLGETAKALNLLRARIEDAMQSGG